MKRLRFVGVDPGFANIGFALVDVLDIGLQLIDTMLVTTTANKKIPDDEQRRLTLVEDAFREFIHERNVDVLAMEAPAAGLMPGRGSRGWAVNPTTVRTTALVWGGIHGICRDRGIYCVKVNLGAIKRVLCGKKSASKQDVIDTVQARFPAYCDWPTTKKVEHVADAVGTVLVAQNDPVVMIMLRQLRTGA